MSVAKYQTCVTEKIVENVDNPDDVEIKPTDSVSNVGSKASNKSSSSKSSSSSSRSSSTSIIAVQAKAEAKRAALLRVPQQWKGCMQWRGRRRHCAKNWRK